MEKVQKWGFRKAQTKKNHVSKCGIRDRARPQRGVVHDAGRGEDPGRKRQRRLRRASQQDGGCFTPADLGEMEGSSNLWCWWSLNALQSECGRTEFLQSPWGKCLAQRRHVLWFSGAFLMQPTNWVLPGFFFFYGTGIASPGSLRLEGLPGRIHDHNKLFFPLY